nr:hypothetical protein [Desulfonema magnum]
MNFFRKKICDLTEGGLDPSPGVLTGEPFGSGIGRPDGIFFADRGQNDACGFAKHILALVIIVNFVTVTDCPSGQIGSHLPENGDIRIFSGGGHKFCRFSGGGHDHINPYSVKNTGV